jgi:hypothetical protein
MKISNSAECDNCTSKELEIQILLNKVRVLESKYLNHDRRDFSGTEAISNELFTIKSSTSWRVALILSRYFRFLKNITVVRKIGRNLLRR